MPAGRLNALIILFLSLDLSAYASETRKVYIRDTCVEAEIADSEAGRRQGLMFRRELPEDEGMLFVFERQERHAFWMKDMNFALDIIWIDGDKKIVEIKEDCPPCQIVCPDLVPLKDATYVLEVNAGFSRKNKIQVGDKAEF